VSVLGAACQSNHPRRAVRLSILASRYSNMAPVCRTAPSAVSAVAQQRSQPILPARCAAAAGAGSGRQQQRPRRQRRQHVCSASGSATSSSSEAQQLLDQFWQARGVVDEQQRRRLVAAAGGIQAESGEEYYRQLELPTASAAWFLEEGASPEVGRGRGCLLSGNAGCNALRRCAALR
jgi:hypothetical protein